MIGVEKRPSEHRAASPRRVFSGVRARRVRVRLPRRLSTGKTSHALSPTLSESSAWFVRLATGIRPGLAPARSRREFIEGAHDNAIPWVDGSGGLRAGRLGAR